MNEKTLKYLSNQMNFEAIHNTLENKRVKSNDHLSMWANSGKRLLGDALKGIESLTQEEYYLVENLEEIANAFGYEKINQENVKEISSSIKKAVINLDEFQKGQEDFYGSKEAEELSRVCKNLSDFYGFIYKKNALSSLENDY